MKQPKEPIKPRHPSAPNEYLPGQKESVTLYTGVSLAEILKEIGDVDPEKVSFDATSGYYDDYTYEFSWDGTPRLNTRYGIELKEYEKKMVKYHKDIQIYNSDLKEFNSLNKQYLKWYHENELKKLG